MTKQSILLAFCVISLTGCSSWLEDRRQTVSVQTYEGTTPVAGVACQLVNDQGQWALTTPGQVQVIASAQDLVVTCSKSKGTTDSTGISNAIARPTPGYLINPTSAVIVPVGAPSSVDQVVRGVAQVYPADIHVVMDEEILVTSNK